MGAVKQAIYFLFHPTELRSIIQWKVWHEPVHRRDEEKESETMKSCFKFLNLTSRSFSAVIQELHPELLVPVTMFYLLLRGLDTIEDDMTIDMATKEPLLRNFHKNMEVDGWTFKGNGPNEKDRELLVHFDDVITELKKIKEPYYVIIKDITDKMGNGMADYALKGEEEAHGVETIAEYEEYCHYVAGLVGDGLTRLFVEAKLANPALLERPDLTESMGQFLQKTNVIRDIREDWDDKRRWWPKEIWGKYVDKWEDLFDPSKRDIALQVSSEMVLNALGHAEDCLFYMAGVKEQSVFNFVAIPQSMAIATLELIYRNPEVFEKNIKIKKGDACQLMTESTQNLRVVCDVFKRYARRIHQKSDPRDPNYMAISVKCGSIEKFIESIFPSQKPEVEEAKQDEVSFTLKETLVLTFFVLAVLGAVSALMVGTAYLLGVKFGSEFEEFFGLRKIATDTITSAITEATETAGGVAHGEL
ncbi:farnesyl-diphosphate farnesyl transferase [Zalerion maritima]|uniref:Squalene synthase n=1 Tax=Zalerion maritima TaxID=339359 RepID=A0AAD5RJ56_9PEZI|nr:farnesyl-diphosphate farnesyl transferase [Zalerion maritima]